MDRQSQASKFKQRLIIVVGGCVILFLLLLGYLFLGQQQPEQTTRSTMENEVDVVVAVEQLPAGAYIDEESVALVKVPESDETVNTLDNIEDVIGKVVRYELQQNEMVTSDKIIDEITFDVLITEKSIAQGTRITEESVKVETVSLSNLGQIPIKGSNPLTGFDYFYLGEIRAVETIAPGQMISWEVVSLEPIENFQDILAKTPQGSIEDNPFQTEDLPSMEQVLGTSSFSAFEFVLSFIVGMGSTLLFSRILYSHQD